MDVIRETSFYATQCEHNTLNTQAENQLLFANIWLNFVRKKASTRISKYPLTMPMWLLPGIHFLHHVCSLHFSNHIDDNLFSKFYYNMKKTMNYLNKPNNYQSQGTLTSKKIQYASITKNGYDMRKKKKLLLSRIEQLDRLDKRIDRRRVDEGLIGKIKMVYNISSLSKKMDDDLAYLKIRNFHKLNLLSCGQYATSRICFVLLNNNKKKDCK